MTRRKYSLGDQVNSWTVVNIDPAKDPYSYEVMCKCGYRKWSDTTGLRNIKGCRRCSLADKILVGDRFGPSVVLKELPRCKHGRLFLVDCDCGNTHELIHKTLKARKFCTGVVGDRLQSGSAIAQALRAFPRAPRGIKRSKVYELWVWLRREHDAPVCDRWKDDFVTFVKDFASIMGGTPLEYLSPRIQHVYYTLERLDKEGIWEPDNVTTRKLFSERAYHRATYNYWRLLLSRDLLDDEFKEDYIQFLNTFGEKQVGYVLRRRDKRILHNRLNSYWHRRGRSSNELGATDGSAQISQDAGPEGSGNL
jgi:hypothetical protein